MSTHRQVMAALERAVKAHRNTHRDHLKAANLEDYTEQTVTPGLPAGVVVTGTGIDDI